MFLSWQQYGTMCSVIVNTRLAGRTGVACRLEVEPSNSLRRERCSTRIDRRRDGAFPIAGGQASISRCQVRSTPRGNLRLTWVS